MAIDVLTFAHFAEAQTFIDGLNLTQDEGFSNIYSRYDLYLLITGQGIDNVRESLKVFLSKTGDDVNRIFNFGIVGKLDQQLTLNKVYPISTVFFSDRRSFIINRDRGISCLTSTKFVSDEKTAAEMAQIAQVVDMELFAVAELTAEFNKHLSAYKIISDDASKNTDLEAIKANAHIYSETLYKYYIENYKLK